MFLVVQGFPAPAGFRGEKPLTNHTSQNFYNVLKLCSSANLLNIKTRIANRFPKRDRMRPTSA